MPIIKLISSSLKSDKNCSLEIDEYKCKEDYCDNCGDCMACYSDYCDNGCSCVHSVSDAIIDKYKEYDGTGQISSSIEDELRSMIKNERKISKEKFFNEKKNSITEPEPEYEDLESQIAAAQGPQCQGGLCD